MINSNNDFSFLSKETMDLLEEHIEAKPYLNKDQLIYKALKTLDLEKEIICNCCGLTCKLNDEDANGNYGLINASVSGHYASTPGNGSGALDDCTSYSFSLCEFCCDWLFQQFVKPVNANSMGDEEEFKSAEEWVNGSPEWRKMRDKFFNEKNKRDLARSKK